MLILSNILIESDIKNIEYEEFFKQSVKKIKKIISENLKIERKDVSISDAKKLMEDRNESYKLELIKDLSEKQDSVTINDVKYNS